MSAVGKLPSETRAARRSLSLGKMLWENKAAVFGGAILAVIIFSALFGPLFIPSSSTQINVSERLHPAAWMDGGSWTNVLGTDALGRDVFGRLVESARITLYIGVTVVLLSLLVGTVLGLIAGYKGGLWDAVIMRLADAQLAFPGLLLVMLVLAVLGSSLNVIIAVVAIYGWMIYARLVRGLVLQLRQTPAIVAAELVGCSVPRILFKHLLPNVRSALVTQAMIELARVILVEASLSYLGLGVQPPQASWGLMVAENQAFISSAWWTVVFPGLAISITVVAINMVANWLRVQTDAKQRQRRLGATARIGRSGGRDRSSKNPSDQGTELRAAPSDSAQPPLLEVSGLNVSFHTADGEYPAVLDGNLSIRPGETVGIVGESGSGKSTMALSLINLVPLPGQVEGADIRWEGKPISMAEIDRLRGASISMIFQDPMTSLNPLMTVGQQVREVLIKHRGMSRKAASERTIELFKQVGIPNAEARLKQYPYQLSGGLRQRVMIAAALAPEPKLLIADEPTTALDTTVQAQILELISDLQERLGIAMLIITHDLGVVARVCDRVTVMYAGRVVEEAAVDNLFASPRHQYTEALISTVPRLEQDKGKLPTIPGHPPGRLTVTGGCPFAPRCANASETCVTEPPPTVVDDDRSYSCWHPSENSNSAPDPLVVRTS